MLSQKLWVNVGIFKLAGENRPSAAKNPLDLPLIPLASVLSAITP
jgi:hypothetical protein